MFRQVSFKKMSRQFIVLGLVLLLALCAAGAAGREGLVRLYVDPQEEPLPNSENGDYSLSTHLRSGLRNRHLPRNSFGILFSGLVGKTAPIAAAARNRQISLYAPLARQNLYEELRVFRI